MEESLATPEKQIVFDYERWESQLPELRKQYDTEDPFPHIMIDNFLEPWAATKAKDAFPSVKDDGWIHYVHFNLGFKS